jgi:hypothetical protein
LVTRFGEYGRFDALFGKRRIDLAPTSIYTALGRANIDTLGVRIAATPGPRTNVFAIYRTMRLADGADVFASTGVQDPTGQSGRDGGRQLDVRLRHRLEHESLLLDAGITQLWAGSFLHNAPNATHEGDTTYFYFDITYTFGGK